MAIRTIDDLRREAPAEYADLDDASLVREFAHRNNVSASSMLDYFGVRPEGTASYMASAVAGGVHDVRDMAGKAATYLSRELGMENSGLARYGAEATAAAAAREHQYEPDDRGRGEVAKFVGTGLRAAVPVVPTLGAAVLGGPVSLGLSAVGTGALFGGSEAENAYQEVYKATGDEEAAFAAARRVGLLHGGGEAAAALAGGAVLKAGRGLVGAGARTTEEVAKRATTKQGLSTLAGAMATNVGVQAGTEVVQDVGGQMITESYGAAPHDQWETAKDSAYGGAALATLMAPLGIGGHVKQRARARELDYALFGKHNDEALRARALDGVMAEAERQKVDPADIDSWFDARLQAMDKDIAQQDAAIAEPEAETAAPRQSRVDEALAANQAPGTVRSTAEQIAFATGTGAERYAGPDYEQQFRETYTNPEPNEVVDADGNLVQRTPAPGGVDSLQRAGYTPAQIDEILAERARTVAPPPSQQMEIDLLGGQAIDAPPSARGLQRSAPAAEQVAPTPFNPA